METNPLSELNSDAFAETESSKENSSFVKPYAELINQTTGEVYSLRKDLEFIGRSYTALISLKDIEVSRKHCTFLKLTENLCGFTTVGRIGTIVNGVVCPPNAQIVLCTGDEIKVMSHVFIFKYTKDSLATAMEESIKEGTNKSIEERRDSFDRSQYLEKEKLNNWFRNLQEKNSEEIRNFEKIISKCSSKNNAKPEEADKEKDALRKEMKRMVDEFEKRKEEWLKQEKLLEDRLLQQKKEFEQKLELEIQATTVYHDVKINGLKRTADHFKNEYEISERTKTKLEKECDEVKEQLKNKEQEFKERESKCMFECLGRDLECGICSELCVQPMLLNCGHLFCKFCIATWKKKKKECPMCRTKIKTEIRNWSYDSIIEKMLKFLPEEERQQRERLVSERTGQSGGKSFSSRPKEPAASTSVIRHASTLRPNSTQRNSATEFVEGSDLFRWAEPARLRIVPHELLFMPTATRSRSNPNDSVVIVDDEALPPTVDLTHIPSEPVNLVHTPREVAVDLSNRQNQLRVEEIDLTSPAPPVSALRR